MRLIALILCVWAGWCWASPDVFEPDRRSVVHIPTWTGDPDHPRRLGSWWAAQHVPIGQTSAEVGMTRLLARMDILYAQGFRRFSMKLPAGDPDIDIVNGRKMASSQWWTLPVEVRAQFLTRFAAWMQAHPDATAGIYAGYHPCNPYLLSMEGAEVIDRDYLALDLTDPVHRARAASVDHRVASAFMPWLEAGVVEFWADNSGPQNLWPLIPALRAKHGLRFGGEAVPCTFEPDDCPPTAEAVTSAPWVETFEVAEHRHYRTRFEPTTSEIHLWLSGHYGYRRGEDPATARPWNFDDLVRFHELGWILDPEFAFRGVDVWTKGYRACSVEYYSQTASGRIIRTDGGGSAFLGGVEAVQRINDCGFVACIADFNGNGKVEVEPPGPGSLSGDLTAFYQRWSRSMAAKPATHTFIDGDVNSDGVIDWVDFEVFGLAAIHHREFRADAANEKKLYTPPPWAGVNLGPADSAAPAGAGA